MNPPQPLGLRRSFGFGDRLGIATPGHLAAVTGSTFVPVFAQQSIREMQRTDRTPRQVMDCATSALDAAGFCGIWGADGDHLQSPSDVAAVSEAGFCCFTIDPSHHVHCDADVLPPEQLASKRAALDLDLELDQAMDLYHGTSHQVADGVTLTFDDPLALQRALVKYGAALRHTEVMHRAIHTSSHTSSGDRPYELELSVDETDTATQPLEHLFIGLELRRRGVFLVSLAPRFVGDFEKGVDYRGDPHRFAAHYAVHAAIARYCGPYKLSIHSGSDKFSVYPVMGRISGEHLHVKTAGTSYLEAMRVLCRVERELFREIVAYARGRFTADCATYHISGRLADVPADPPAAELEECYLERDAGRQILHVTYGSVLTAGGFKSRVMDSLGRHADLHTELVAQHLGKHLRLLESDERDARLPLGSG